MSWDPKNPPDKHPKAICYLWRKGADWESRVLVWGPHMITESELHILLLDILIQKISRMNSIQEIQNEPYLEMANSFSDLMYIYV